MSIYISEYDVMLPWKIFIALCLAVLIFGLSLFFIEIFSESNEEKREKELNSYGCIMQSETKTGNISFCGKYCIQHEVIREYICSFGEHYVFFKGNKIYP